MAERGREHQGDALAPRGTVKTSHMRDHVTSEHGGRLGEITALFRMDMKMSATSALERQVREAVEIGRAGRDVTLLNQKEEYNSCLLPTMLMEGPRPIREQEDQDVGKGAPSITLEQEEEALNQARKDLKTRLGAYREEQGPPVKKLRTGLNTASVREEDEEVRLPGDPPTIPCYSTREGTGKTRTTRRAGRRITRERQAGEEVQEGGQAGQAPQPPPTGEASGPPHQVDSSPQVSHQVATKQADLNRYGFTLMKEKSGGISTGRIEDEKAQDEDEVDADKKMEEEKEKVMMLMTRGSGRGGRRGGCRGRRAPPPSTAGSPSLEGRVGSSDLKVHSGISKQRSKTHAIQRGVRDIREFFTFKDQHNCMNLIVTHTGVQNQSINPNPLGEYPVDDMLNGGRKGGGGEGGS